MQVQVFDSKQDLGVAAAERAADRIRRALADRGAANIILATGASQFDTLAALVQAPGIDWGRVTAFHLDEYVGLDDTHPASFRKYLRERFVEQIPETVAAFHYVDGSAADPEAECARLGRLIAEHPVDVGCIGIGENGHLAFNDPPADFETTKPYLVVDLDEACRQQQVGEGWFGSLDEVPKQAISMSIRQILSCRHLVVSCPDERKAAAVRGAVEGPVTPACPASILRQHAECRLYLDAGSASELQAG
ncbi:MAG: glucosamine-6-phosphate deaminase [Planctomycetota bacterium]